MDSIKSEERNVLSVYQLKGPQLSYALGYHKMRFLSNEIAQSTFPGIAKGCNSRQESFPWEIKIELVEEFTSRHCPRKKQSFRENKKLERKKIEMLRNSLPGTFQDIFCFTQSRNVYAILTEILFFPRRKMSKVLF